MSNRSSHARSSAIDFLRIFSCLIVVLSHYGLINFFTGTQGVVVFLIISGYCMAYSTNGRGVLEFLSARLWRLVPPLVMCATITFLLKFYFLDVQSERFVSERDYIGNLLCLPNGNLLCDIAIDIAKGRAGSYRWVDGVYWSLLVEIRFYFLLALLFYVFKVRYVSIAISVLGLLAPLGLSTSLISKSEDFFLYLSFFSFGLAYNSLSKGNWKSLLALAFALATYIVSCYFGSYGISMKLNSDNFFMYFICFLIFVLGMIFFNGRSNRLIAYFGLLTYPIYLLHQDIGLILIEGMQNHFGFLPARLLTIILIISISVIVNYVVERFQPLFRHFVADLIKRYLLFHR